MSKKLVSNTRFIESNAFQHVVKSFIFGDKPHCCVMCGLSTYFLWSHFCHRDDFNILFCGMSCAWERHPDSLDEYDNRSIIQFDYGDNQMYYIDPTRFLRSLLPFLSCNKSRVIRQFGSKFYEDLHDKHLQRSRTYCWSCEKYRDWSPFPRYPYPSQRCCKDCNDEMLMYIAKMFEE
jgi:hypothetical protein